MKPSKDIH